jgi:hypothetical protein
MTNTSLSSLFLALSLAACAATTPSPTTPAPAPIATPPADWKVFAGPHATLEAACAGCQLSPIHSLSTGTDFVAVAQGSRGLEGFVALQTARGWYLEQREAMPPMHSHHEPRSLYYDVAKTRIADGVVLRMVDSSQVFYPGQGNAGSSHTNWFDRTCRVFGDQVACSTPVSIATRHCKRDSIGNGETNEQCTGNEP